MYSPSVGECVDLLDPAARWKQCSFHRATRCQVVKVGNGGKAEFAFEASSLE